MATDRKVAMPLYVQYGCGMSAPAGWRNFDASPTLRFERIPLIGYLYTKNAQRFPRNVEYGDVVKGLPVAPGSCDGVYCSHVLEHLALTDLRTALRMTRAMLKPDGVFRLVVPDLETLARDYLSERSPNAAHRFMRQTGLGIEVRPRGVVSVLKAWIGNSAHLWMWDYQSLQSELSNAGFQKIRRAAFGDADDPAFQLVEDEGRWENCLGIEARLAS